eukprot:792283-Pyramimonas_sp.AAC.2
MDDDWYSFSYDDVRFSWIMLQRMGGSDLPTVLCPVYSCTPSSAWRTRMDPSDEGRGYIPTGQSN